MDFDKEFHEWWTSQTGKTWNNQHTIDIMVKTAYNAGREQGRTDGLTEAAEVAINFNNEAACVLTMRAISANVLKLKEVKP